MDRLAQELKNNPDAQLGPMVKCIKCDGYHQSILTPNIVHYAKYWCKGNILWLPKNDSEKKPKRKSHAELLPLIHENMRGFCAICLRTKQHLQSLQPVVTMDVHHIIPVENGGKDVSENLQLLCYQCHADVHRMRERTIRYFP